MVSIKDIAARCHVSPATVSKSLNGHRDISQETRQRVCETARKMGYLPNSAARALKTNRTYNIGVLFIDKTQSGLKHQYFSKVLDSVKVQAERLGYDITFLSQNIGQHPMSFYEHCRYRGCDGVVTASIDFKDPGFLELVESDIPLVTIDHVFNNRTAILSDNIKGVQDLVRYIYQCGHRKIAFIHGEYTSVTKKRMASFYKTCEELGVEVPEAYVRQAVYHEPSASARATRELLALADRPTCIMYPDDFSFIGGMNEIEKAGLRIPDDISVTGFDGIYLSQVLRPTLTTLRQDTEKLGKLAVESLVEIIEHPKTTLSKQVLIEGELLKGGSVKQL